MKVYSVADNTISPLGFDSTQNFQALLAAQSGISYLHNNSLFPEPLHAAYLGMDALTEKHQNEQLLDYTYLEQLFIHSIQQVLDQLPGLDRSRVGMVLSTTKGNIDLIGQANGEPAERLSIPAMAQAISSYFHLLHAPVVISNACISGVSAILVAKKLISMGQYDHVLVTGGDILSEFTISGFQSLKAISDEPCRPYDAARKGITLGEACGTMLLSKDAALCSLPESLALIAGGGQSNDANHISGPSRTGKGLKLAIEQALSSSKLSKERLGHINAHGTATLYNDEMEAIAFGDMGLDQVPMNSLKGYFGHTLGAAGIIESIMAIRQLNTATLVPSLGYQQLGVSKDLKLITHTHEVAPLQAVLKTVSGFGGCNAAVILEKA